MEVVFQTSRNCIAPVLWWSELIAAAGGQSVVNAGFTHVPARAVGGIHFRMSVPESDDHGAIGWTDGKADVVGIGPAEAQRQARAGGGLGIVKALEFKRQATTRKLEVNVVVGVISGCEIDRVFGSGLCGVAVAQSQAGDGDGQRLRIDGNLAA